MPSRSKSAGREPKPRSKPRRILFIGNSFTNRNDMPGMLERLGAADSPAVEIQTDRVIANGMPLRAHWNKGAARAAIAGSKWDDVVLQEQSTLPLKNRQRMHESITLFDGIVRASGAKTVLYLTWARRTEFSRQAELTDAYTSIGRQLGCIVVPVGVAWQRALERKPEMVLHDADNSHPNLAGSYLAACVFYATLFGRNPQGIQTDDVGGRQLPREEAFFLHEIADRTVNPQTKSAMKS